MKYTNPPQRNLPPRGVIRGSEDKQVYLDNVLDKFVSEYLITTNYNNHLEYGEALEDNQDLVRGVFSMSSKALLHLRKCERICKIR